MTSGEPRRVLYLDCFSGLSGDMIVSALLDVGVPLSVIADAASKLPLQNYQIRHEREMRNAIAVSRFHVDVNESKQPHRHFSQIRDMIVSSTLSEDIKQMSIRIFEVLAVAEAKVHGTTIEKVHFHEVGAIDSIVDIVGAAAGISYLDVDVTCGRIPLGRGFIHTQHGLLPLPAPATLNILQDVPVIGTDVESELTTPTGAAIVKALSVHFGTMPSMTFECTGFGAGARNIPGSSGILRVVLGRPQSVISHAECVVLEANIDDMTGEMAGHAMTQLLLRGALDVWVEHIQMKKGRPALKLCVLCRETQREAIGDAMMTETTTIGLRYYGVGRMELRRMFETVNTQWGPVKIKVSVADSGMKNVSAEFEDCKKIALENGLALKDVTAAAMVAFYRGAEE